MTQRCDEGAADADAGPERSEWPTGGVKGRASATTVLMWEVVAAEGRIDELVTLVEQASPPQAHVYRAEDRVVVIDPTGTGPGEVPGELVARPPHAWPFDEVARTGDAQHSL